MWAFCSNSTHQQMGSVSQVEKDLVGCVAKSGRAAVGRAVMDTRADTRACSGFSDSGPTATHLHESLPKRNPGWRS